MATDPRSGAAVGRLFEALRESLASRGGAAGEVTVSEIYQTLVPYARARSELGFEMNADYEHALMRLIAGEGGFARLEPQEARAQVTRELESSNPDVTLYRRFAASTVRLSQSAAPASPAVPSPNVPSPNVASPNVGSPNVPSPTVASPNVPSAERPPRAATEDPSSRYVALAAADRAARDGAGTDASSGRSAETRRSSPEDAGSTGAADATLESASWRQALDRVAAPLRSPDAAGAGDPRAAAPPAADARPTGSPPDVDARRTGSPPDVDARRTGSPPDADTRRTGSPPDAPSAETSAVDEALVARSERALDDGLARLSSLLAAPESAGRAPAGATEPSRPPDAGRPESASPEDPASALPDDPESASPEAPESALPEDPESASPEAPESASPGVRESASPGVRESASADDSESALPEAPESGARDSRRPDACGSCGKDLPTGRDVRFCPYCGSEQPQVCAACGDDMEPDWRYCPSCGTEP